jgi:HK97 family phage prohead protease
MDIIYKHFSFEIKEALEKKEKNSFVFEGYASTFDIDLEDDRIVPGAFKESIKEQMPKLLWGHNPHEPAIGTIDIAKEDGKGLFITASMPTSDSLVRDRIMPQMKHGSINQMSIGFKIVDSEIIENEEQAKAYRFTFEKVIRLIKEVKLFEVSLVNFPANPEAMVTELQKMLKHYDRKTLIENATTPWSSLPNSLAEKDTSWDAAKAIERWREKSGSTEKPSKTYKENFLWHDAANKDSFESYKLPIGDMIGDKHKAVPHAIFAARAVLAGARGGVDIPEKDINGIKNNINRYYEKIGLDKPFNEKQTNKWTENEISGLNAGELSFVLRNEKVNRNAADAIARRFTQKGEVATQKGEGNLEVSHYSDLAEKIKQMRKQLKNEV